MEGARYTRIVPIDLASNPSKGPADAQIVSDEALNRALRWLLVALAAIVAVIAIGTGGLWLKHRYVKPGPLAPIDLGFVQDMIDHHEQAIVIANTYLANNATGAAASFVREVPLYQGRDLREMDKMLSESGQTRGASDRQAMAWMGMGTPVATMPGMQTAEAIEQLAAARGAAADRLFFDLMTDHHRGGIHMAQYAAKAASRKEVRAFADYVAKGQNIEINEYAQAVKRLGL